MGGNMIRTMCLMMSRPVSAPDVVKWALRSGAWTPARRHDALIAEGETTVGRLDALTVVRVVLADVDLAIGAAQLEAAKAMLLEP